MGTAQGTVLVTPEITHGQQLLIAWKGGDMAEALRLAATGAQLYPAYRVPVTGGNMPTYETVAAAIARKLGVPVPVASKKAAKKAAKAERKAIAAAPPAEPQVQAAELQTVTLRLVHRVGESTSLYGVEKDSPAMRIIGSARNGGLGWRWYDPKKVFYIWGSGKFAAQMGKINEAKVALEAYAGPEPVRYVVSVDISNIDPATGVEAEPYETAAQRRQTAAAERAAQRAAAAAERRAAAERLAAQRAAERAAQRAIERQAAQMTPEVDILAMLAEPGKVKVTAPEPVAEPVAEPVGVVGKVWVFKLADRLSSGTKSSEIATGLRSDLANRVSALYAGMRFEVRLDKKARTLTVTVMAAPSDVNITKLSVQVRGTALTVAGIAA